MYQEELLLGMMKAHSSADFFNFSATQVVKLYIQHGTEGSLDLFPLYGLSLWKKSIALENLMFYQHLHQCLFFSFSFFFQFSYVATNNYPNEDLALLRYICF